VGKRVFAHREDFHLGCDEDCSQGRRGSVPDSARRPFFDAQPARRRPGARSVGGGNGEGKPGQSGNPAGKPKGARHRATQMLEKILLDGAEETVLRF
jgi:hypothetical protein